MKPRFLVTLEAPHASSGIRELRQILKTLLRRHHFKCVGAKEFRPTKRNARRALPRHNRTVNAMPNDLMKSDGFDDDDATTRIIKGGLIKCKDGIWKHDEETIGGEQLFLVVGTAECVQRWEDGKPVETI